MGDEFILGNKALTSEILPERVMMQSCDEITQNHSVDVEFQADQPSNWFHRVSVMF